VYLRLVAEQMDEFISKEFVLVDRPWKAKFLSDFLKDMSRRK
jgi:hypothetical protein